MRVSELAKLVKATSKDVIEELDKMGLKGKKHMSNVDDEIATQVMVVFDQRKLVERAKQEEEERIVREAEEKKRREEEARVRREDEERRRREEEERRIQEEQKRQEEEKRRQEEEEIRRKLEESRLAGTATPAEPQTTSTPESTTEKKPEKKRRKKKDDKPLVVPEIAVMKIDKPRRKKGGRQAKGNEEDRKKFKPTRLFTDEDIYVSKSPKGKKGRQKTVGEKKQPVAETAKVQESRRVTIKGDVTIGQFAEKIDISPMEIISRLMQEGEMLTINQMLPPDWCELIAAEFDVELDYAPESDEMDVEQFKHETKKENLTERPPVVTIMGHVDHGKTTLLDYIRKSRVAEQEFGAITQHIGAYHVETPRGPITFLDTPGHEAFTSMRARGVKVTDIVILVVAANDGVMPQTIEAINHTKSAGVPIIVAINKMDLPDANPSRVKQELMQHEIIGEDLGGEVIMVELSAKKGEGVDNLLEMVILQSEVLELQADPTIPAEGIIIESHLDPARGVIASVLITQGLLKLGDNFLAGAAAGRARALLDDFGKPVEEIAPGYPVEIIGFNSVPEVGDMFNVMPDEKVAREIAETRQTRRRFRSDAAASKHVSLDNLHEMVETGELKELNLIIKGDVQGSVEAIRQAIEGIHHEKMNVRIVHTGVGSVLETDVTLAMASGAIILGFNVRPTPQATELADSEKIDIRLYRIIYDLIADVKQAIVGLLDPVYKEIHVGRANVKQLFQISGVGGVAGCLVVEGEVHRGYKARVMRDGVVVYDGEIESIRRVKDDVAKVASGTECGINLKNFNDVKPGDEIECFKLEEIPQEV